MQLLTTTFPRRRLASAASLLACALLSSPSAPAQEANPERRVLPLEEVIGQALRQNLSLQVDRFDAVASEAAVASEEAAFDPVLFARGNLSSEDYENAGTPVEVEGEGGDIVLVPFPTSSDSRSYSAGVSKRLRVTNATLQASTNLFRREGTTFDPTLGESFGGNLSETATLGLTLNQPLLRGFGRDIAEAPMERARAGDRATIERLRMTVLEIISATETAYWELAAALDRRRLGETNRELAENLLEETRERERLGLATRLEVIQAEANLAQRDEDILVADQAVADARDGVLVLTGAMDPEQALTPEFDAEELPPAAAEMPAFDQVWQRALANDPSSAAQEEVIAQREIDRRLARDERKPELDLTLAGRLGGRSDEDASEAYDLILDRDGREWEIGLAFSMPFGRRAAKADQRAAEARLAQAEMELARVKQDLLQDVRAAWRDLDSRRQRLRAAELVLRLQEETFERERSRFDEGLSTFRDVLEIQRDLDNARLSLLSARSAAIQAEVRLERLQGTLLERHGLDWSGALPGVAR